MGEIAMMPEGLVKISTQLYETVLPLVRTQVESQIKGEKPCTKTPSHAF